jgi:hypothetical protein
MSGATPMSGGNDTVVATSMESNVGATGDDTSDRREMINGKEYDFWVGIARKGSELEICW